MNPNTQPDGHPPATLTGGDAASPDPEHLFTLANYRMPFGKYQGTRLVDLPEAYIVWFARKGYPEGKLGLLLREMYDIKANGLEHVLAPFRRKA